MKMLKWYNSTRKLKSPILRENKNFNLLTKKRGKSKKSLKINFKKLLLKNDEKIKVMKL